MPIPNKPKIKKKKIDGCNEEGYKEIEVTIKMWLPEHWHYFDLMMAASKYYTAIWDIYHECRHVWKYEDDPSEEKIIFAEKIADMCNDTDFWDIP